MFRLALSILAFASIAASIPAYGSLSSRQGVVNYGVPFPPPPIPFNGSQLSNDPDHPFMAQGPNDMRGPCPALNTMASHGFIPRNGIATPVQLIQGIMDGLNMARDLGIFLAYNAFMVDGNPLTNLISIGAKTNQTGDVNPPAPAVVGGLDTHLLFEGDTSMTRLDFFFTGDNHSPNPGLIQQFLDLNQIVGNGFYNLTTAAELRFLRTQQSIATNPTMTLVAPRIFSAYSEAVLPFLLFRDGRVTEMQVPNSTIISFFQNMMLPDDFFRATEPLTLAQILVFMNEIFYIHPVLAGANDGVSVNTYTAQNNATTFNDLCPLYTGFVSNLVPSLYPIETVDPFVRDVLRGNMNNFFQAFEQFGCTQVFPYGGVAYFG